VILIKPSSNFGTPDCSSTFSVQTSGNIPACAASAVNYDGLLPGTYWLAFAADDGNPIFDGYPCSLSHDGQGWVYNFSLTTTPITCVGVIDCSASSIEADPGLCSGGTYVDTYDGGCDVTGTTSNPTTLTLTCGANWCGDSGAKTVTNTGKPYDTDWYKLTLGSASRLTFSVNAEFRVKIEIYEPNNTVCGVMRETYTIPECAPTSVTFNTARVYSGSVYVRVLPALLTTPCGALYNFAVTCTPATQCAITCPGGSSAEAETCGASTNNGCANTSATLARMETEMRRMRSEQERQVL